MTGSGLVHVISGRGRGSFMRIVLYVAIKHSPTRHIRQVASEMRQ